MAITSIPVRKRREPREHLLATLTAATLLIFFQAYMMAPIIPHLAEVFSVSHQTIGLIVPAYMISYGVTSLIFGLVSDRVGRRPVMLLSLFAVMILTLLSATAQSATQLILWRLLTGLSASGTIPQLLTLIGELYPYGERGRPLGWIFGAMGGGMATGSVFGGLLQPIVTWRGLFIIVGIMSGILFQQLWRQRHLISSKKATIPWNTGDLLEGYKLLLTSPRGARTYSHVLLNGIFHAGVYTWLGLYLSQRYNFDEAQIGLTLLGYGIPGICFGPMIGRAADRWGRNRILPIGFAVAAISAIILAPQVPPLIVTLAITGVSLGYDLTQPLLAAIVTDLSLERRGQAMGLNVFALFIGFGIGGFTFGELLRFGFTPALLCFGGGMLAVSLAATILFRTERARSTPTQPDQNLSQPQEALEK